MAKRNLRQIAAALRQPGVYPLPEIALGAPASEFEIAVTRDALPDSALGLLAQINIEGSDDGGASWSHLGGIGVTGGVSINKKGEIQTESVFTIKLSEEKPATYRVRGSAAIFQAITVGLRLTVS